MCHCAMSAMLIRFDRLSPKKEENPPPPQHIQWSGRYHVRNGGGDAALFLLHYVTWAGSWKAGVFALRRFLYVCFVFSRCQVLKRMQLHHKDKRCLWTLKYYIEVLCNIETSGISYLRTLIILSQINTAMNYSSSNNNNNNNNSN